MMTLYRSPDFSCFSCQLPKLCRDFNSFRYVLKEPPKEHCYQFKMTSKQNFQTRKNFKDFTKNI